MNKIVREHYPIANLPDDLRIGLAADSFATVSIAVEDDTGDEMTLEDILALARMEPRRSADDIDADIEALRSGWCERD